MAHHMNVLCVRVYACRYAVVTDDKEWESHPLISKNKIPNIVSIKKIKRKLDQMNSTTDNNNKDNDDTENNNNNNNNNKYETATKLHDNKPTKKKQKM
jgi:hypothetical protein